MIYKNYNDYEILYLVKENDESSLNLLFTKYNPLIYKVANKYYDNTKNNGAELADLLQEGRIGLLRAINSFNQNKDNLFYTYANVCIERAINNYVAKLRSNKQLVLSKAINVTDIVVISSDERNNPVEVLNDKLSYQKFIDCKNELIFSDSNIFELIYNGFTYKEISILLDMKRTTVDSRLCKIRKSLRKLFINEAN